MHGANRECIRAGKLPDVSLYPKWEITGLACVQMFPMPTVTQATQAKPVKVVRMHAKVQNMCRKKSKSLINKGDGK